MNKDRQLQQAKQYLDRLCLDIGYRPVGSAGNRAATAFFAERVSACGFTTETPDFECIEWQEEGASLTVGGESFAVSASPYSLGASVQGPLLAVETDEMLATADLKNKILLLHGEVAGEQLMPKNFPFYNPERHQRIIALLEGGAPLAIVSATTRNPELAGALYPFPLIEDGDFHIPSVYTMDEEGQRLMRQVGQTATLKSNAWRALAQGVNVVARKGHGPRRVVVCAHIDAKLGTPGAIDNGGGVVVLLLLAHLFADYEGELVVEIVALNGEDYYSVPGQQLYLAQNEGRLDEIALAINLDGAGYHKGKTAYSLYGCPPQLEDRLRKTFEARGGFMEGPAWYQGDHAMFVQQGVAALAITSECIWELSTQITHTAKDTPEIVDCGKLVETARALQTVLLEMNG